jgi:deoxyribodipyrimidine photo-lyase
MASANTFAIQLLGRGGHAALPHLTLDPVPVACQLVQALQTIVSRSLRPIDTAVLSVTMVHAGEVTNVVPDACRIEGTVQSRGRDGLSALSGAIVRAWREGGAVDDLPGGPRAAAARLARFVTRGLPRYVEDRNDPDAAVTSGLSPSLHFGHLSAHEVFHAVMQREGWLGEVPRGGRGARAGWWGVSPEAEGFLDQLVTWRELGANACTYLPAYDTYGSLPSWARATMEKHADDVRDPSYTLAELDGATTYDPIWNAAQRELRQDGRLHNYLRMLWGKKILQWTRSPEEALAVMVELNNKYALDGRDPNSYSGIFWTLGRYDRPWGPEREIFGTIRYMSSDNTARKVKLKGYLERYAAQPGLF